MPAAFIDESLRERQPGGAGLYVVAAVVVDGRDQAEAARAGARDVLLRRQLRFHWHEESDRQRRRMLKQLAGLDVVCRAYVCEPIALRREARARALCLNALMWDLWQHLDVDELVIERRQERNNRRDAQTFIAAKRANRVHPQLRYRFDRPEVEPLLWLADAVASATSADAAGHRYLELLGDRLVRIDVDPAA